MNTTAALGTAKPSCDKAFADALTQYVVGLYDQRDNRDFSRVMYLEAGVKFAQDAKLDHTSPERIVEETIAYASDHRDTEVMVPPALAMYLREGLGLEPIEIATAALPWLDNPDEFISTVGLRLIQGSGAFSIEWRAGYTTQATVAGLLQPLSDKQRQAVSPLFWQALFEFDAHTAYLTCLSAQADGSPGVHETEHASFVNWIDLAQSERSFGDYTPGVDPPPDALEMAMARGIADSDDWPAKLFVLSVMDQKPCFEDANIIMKLLKDNSPAVAGVAKLLEGKIIKRERQKQFDQPNNDPKVRGTQWGLISYDGALGRVEWDRPNQFGNGEQYGEIDELSAGAPKTVKLVSPYRIPPTIKMQWTRAGQLVEQTIPLTDSIKQQDHFYGTVWLLYTNGQWEAQMLTAEQSADLRSRTGSAVPRAATASQPADRH